MATNEDLLFAELAMKREALTPEQVDEILDLQKRLREMGLEEPVSTLVVKKRMLSEKDAQALLVRVSPKGGRQQIEGYRLVERLGRGGMGAVYKAIQVSMGRPVALKVLKPSLVKNDQQTERLRREAQLVGKLRHPNIVQGLDVGVSNGFHYFAMEYVEGRSVKEAIEQDGPMREKEAIRIVRQVTLALDHAHREGIVHRDVKPGNILLGRDGAVFLADYGLAKGPLEDVELTHSGVTVGTPQYISPEQARGPSDVDIRTDLYSLGATLYHMVTGRPPYEGETLAHLIQQVLYEPYAPPRSLRRDLSVSVDFLIEKLMARKPRHRYHSPRDLLRDLDAIEKGKPIVPAGWQGDFESFHLRRKYRRLVAATILVLLLTGAASLVWVWRLRELEHQARETAAGETLQGMLVVEPAPDGIAERIREFEEFVASEKYRGTVAATRVAEEILPGYRSQLPHVLALQKRTQEELVPFEREGRFADAQAVLRRFIDERTGLSQNEIGPAISLAEEALSTLLTRRDEAVSALVEEERKRVVHEDPEPALDRLRGFTDRLSSLMYLPVELVGGVPDPIREVRFLGDGLERAIAGTREHLRPAEELLGGTPPLDYRSVRQAVEDGRRDFSADTGLRQALANLPEGWRANLESRLSGLDRRALTLNHAERVKALEDARGWVESLNAYERAAAELGALAGRSLPEAAGDLRDQAREYQDELTRLRSQADQAFADFLAPWLRFLGRRHWHAANQSLHQLTVEVSTHQTSRYPGIVQGAHLVLSQAESFEASALSRIHELGQLPDGLRFGPTRYPQIYAVKVQGGNVSFRARDGTQFTKPVAEIALEDLLRHSGREPTDPHLRFVIALLRLGELEEAGAARALRDEIDRSIDPALASVLQDPGLAALSLEVRGYVRGLRSRAAQQVESLEAFARSVFDQIGGHYRFGRWQEVYDGIRSLFDDENLSETEWVKQNRKTLESQLEEAKKHLPSVQMRDYFRSDSTHLAGESVSSRKFRERIQFDFEDPGQLERFEFTKDRVGILEDERVVLGPPPPGVGLEQERTHVEHLLGILPGLDGDLNTRDHPLQTESPFIYSEEMAIEFRARWAWPVALLLSLSGTNVVILSDDGRPQAGRGVHFWQSDDLTRPDLVVPENLRKSSLEERPELLEGPSRYHEYFQFEPNRWYRIRFVKGVREARLEVDGILVLSKEIKTYGVDSGKIVLVTWTPAELDEIAIEGTVDPPWFHRRVVSGRPK